jgi:hypothetical protein
MYNFVTKCYKVSRTSTNSLCAWLKLNGLRRALLRGSAGCEFGNVIPNQQTNVCKQGRGLWIRYGVYTERSLCMLIRYAGSFWEAVGDPLPPWPTEFLSFGDFINIKLLLCLILNLWYVKKESGFTNRVWWNPPPSWHFSQMRPILISFEIC